MCSSPRTARWRPRGRSPPPARTCLASMPTRSGQPRPGESSTRFASTPLRLATQTWPGCSGACSDSRLSRDSPSESQATEPHLARARRLTGRNRPRPRRIVILREIGTSGGRMKRALIAAGLAAATAPAAGYSSSSAASSGSGGGGSDPVLLRLGFLTNITHAPALIGIAKGYFAKDLGKNVKLEVKPFSTARRRARRCWPASSTRPTSAPAGRRARPDRTQGMEGDLAETARDRAGAGRLAAVLSQQLPRRHR